MLVLEQFLKQEVKTAIMRINGDRDSSVYCITIQTGKVGQIGIFDAISHVEKLNF